MNRLLAALICLAASLHAAPPEAILIAVGDQHSASSRTAQFVARIDHLKAANPGVPLAVLIDGDAFELGNGVARRSGGAIEFAMFRALADRVPTVLNVGNHEPEFYDVADVIARIQATGVTVISNLVNRATGRPFVPAATHLKLGAHEVVIVGLTTDLLAQYRAAVRPTLDPTNPVVWAKQNFPSLLPSASLGIVLSHSGLKYDRDLLPLVPDGTLFVGAHDHQRFVHRIDRTVYFQSGAWNRHLSIARLRYQSGQPVWEIEQMPIDATDPADPDLARMIGETEAKYAAAEDRVIVGHLAAPLGRAEAARFAVRAVRRASGADAAFIGSTTFGDGLPAAVSQRDLDACVRFDGFLCVGEIGGAALRTLLAAANQGPDTPFAERRDEPLVADGPAEISAEKTYRIVTTDWGMRNRGRYFGSESLVFVEHPELRLKAVVTQALNEK